MINEIYALLGADAMLLPYANQRCRLTPEQLRALTPAAIAIQLSLLDGNPIIAKGLSLLGCDVLYPLVKHTAPGLQSRLAAQWSTFLDRMEAVVANACIMVCLFGPR